MESEFCPSRHIHGIHVPTFRSPKKAVDLFRKALDLSEATQSSSNTWVTTYCNLGTALSRIEQHEDAIKNYEKVLDIDPRHSIGLALLGKAELLRKNVDKAIIRFHEVFFHLLYSFS